MTKKRSPKKTPRKFPYKLRVQDDRARIEQELHFLQKVFADGNEAALLDMLCMCREHSIPLPTWALAAVIERQREYILGDNKRHAKWLSRFRQDQIDLARAKVVQGFLHDGADYKNVFELAAAFLEKTACPGGKDAVEKSYKRFKKVQKKSPSRYYTPRYKL